ncbi:antitoxin [Clostridia bacterium]|nr:antitoxin [Clostridia bacterium]
MYEIPKIYPVSDLKSNFGEVSSVVREGSAPVYLTKNGHGDMVLMSMRAYEQMIERYETELKLKEAEAEEMSSAVHYEAKDVIAGLRKRAKENSGK